MKKYSLYDYYQYGKCAFYSMIGHTSCNTQDEHFTAFTISYHHFCNKDDLKILFNKLIESTIDKEQNHSNSICWRNIKLNKRNKRYLYE